MFSKQVLKAEMLPVVGFFSPTVVSLIEVDVGVIIVFIGGELTELVIPHPVVVTSKPKNMILNKKCFSFIF
jgi:hypothetical protein